MMAWNIDTDYSFADMHIGPGDRVLWKGKPEKGITVRSDELALIPFGAFFTMFAVFWISIAMNAGPFAFFGIPFVLVGLYMLGGRFIVNEFMKKSTAYVITDKAIIRKRGNRVDVWYARDLINMKVYSHKNGTTSFMFSTVPAGYTCRRGERVNVYGIENVRDAKDVSAAINQIKS